MRLGGTLVAMQNQPPQTDKPLPATLAFVATVGVLYLVGWFAMFVLLNERW